MRRLIIAALLVTACGNGDDVCSGDAQPTIAIGDGFNDVFEPVGEGERIYLLINGSGRYGLRVALRATGIVPGATGRRDHPDDPRVDVEITIDGARVGGSDVSEQTGELLDEAPHLGFAGTVDDAELVSAPVVFLVSVPPDEFINVPATIRVEVTDQCGTTASVEQMILPWWQF